MKKLFGGLLIHNKTNKNVEDVYIDLFSYNEMIGYLKRWNVEYTMRTNYHPVLWNDCDRRYEFFHITVLKPYQCRGYSKYA